MDLMDIDQLNSEEELVKALEIVNNQIKFIKEASEFDENRYRTFLQKRLKINEKLDKEDELIKEAIRREKYPAAEYFRLGQSIKLTLKYQNNFSHSSDAYVATIHREKMFDFSSRGYSAELVNRMGKEKLNEQVNSKMKRSPGDFILLDHPELNSPSSYNILYYNDEMNLDLDVLEKGIVNVLRNTEKTNKKCLTFFGIGFNYVLIKFKQNQIMKASQIANQITDKVARTIVEYFIDCHKTSIEEITFGFVDNKTMDTYVIAFTRWCTRSLYEFEYLKELNSRQQLFIEQSRTKNQIYKDELKKLSYSIGYDSTIILLGETGVGKSFLAGLIHQNSHRSSGPFKSENCSLINRDRIYITLFGAVKGSYTGAHKDIKGLLEEANGGTLFLDEIGEADLEIQGQLLTFLDTKKFRRLGENKVDRTANVRLIFGTNRNLHDMVSIGAMKRDFHARLDSAVITIPPLRERKEDIPLFVDYIIQQMNNEREFNLKIDDEAIDYLVNKRWPDNIRQLKSIIEIAYNYCHATNTFLLTKQILLNYNIREYDLSNNSFFQLENMFKNFLGEWTPEKGRFLQEFLEPILAKVYIEDLKLNKVDASKILGMTGSKGEDSPLSKRYKLYKELIERLKQ